MGIQGAQMVATLVKGVDFQRGKTGLLNEFSRCKLQEKWTAPSALSGRKRSAQTSRVGKPPAGKLPLFGPVAQLVRSRELIILRPLFESRRDYQWSNGGIGRRNALKMHRCKTCQFKSDFDYHTIHSARGHAKLELF